MTYVEYLSRIVCHKWLDLCSMHATNRINRNPMDMGFSHDKQAHKVLYNNQVPYIDMTIKGVFEGTDI